jgi:hypothetical protein
MKSEHRYCLKTNILSIHTTSEGKKQSLYLPAGAIITVGDLAPKEGPFVEVLWNTKTVLMFPQDILERAQALPTPGYSGLPQAYPLAS